MKKKLIVSILIVFVIGLIIKIIPKEKEYQEEQEGMRLGIYLEQENGTFVYSSSVPDKNEGYMYNASKSSCDEEASITWDNNYWAPVINNINKGSTKCYLFFDISVPGDFEFYIGGESNPEYTNTKDVKTYLSWNETDIKDYCVTEEENIETCNWKPIRQENSLMLMALDYRVDGDYTLNGSDGEKKLYAYIRNNINKVSKVKEDTIILDETIEGITKLELDNNNGYTRDDIVDVVIEWKDKDISHYCLKETEGKPNTSDNCWVGVSGQSVTTNHTFTNKGEGEKTLYAYVKDRAGNITDTTSIATDNIMKDTTPPNPTSLTLSGTRVNGLLQENYSHSSTISATVSWTDLDVAYYCLRNDANVPTESDGCWKDASNKSVTNSNYALATGEGLKTVYAYLKDIAGNITSGTNSKNASITVDTVAPTQNNPSSSNVTTSGFTITINGASDNSTYTGKGILSYCFSTDNSTFTCQSGASKSYNGYSPGTSHTIYVKVRDKSGRESDVKQTTVKTISSDNTLANLGITKVNTESEGCPAETNPTIDGIYNGTGLLCKGKDDDGDTYYYRGAVTNNWVKMGSTYWRIIRINGDGTIRLVYNGKSAGASSTNANYVSDVVFNTYNYNKAEYVGLKYTEGVRNGYSEPSDMFNILNTFYNDYFASGKSLESYASKLDTNAGFCGDRTSNTSSSATSTDNSGGTETTTTYYGGYLRLYNSKKPTFKCPELDTDLYTKKGATQGNKSLVNPIGLITADEAMYAGGLNVNNSGYWLCTGAQYWTMTPSNFHNTGANQGPRVAVITVNGFIGNSDVSGVRIGVRPVINLKADTKFTISGTGTKGSTGNPYVVQ